MLLAQITIFSVVVFYAAGFCNSGISALLAFVSTVFRGAQM